ncbi:hypothetical protein pb186bvf_006137 [Paramecium bursaria]
MSNKVRQTVVQELTKLLQEESSSDGAGDLAAQLEQAAFEISKGENNRDYRTRINTLKMKLKGQRSQSLRQILFNGSLKPTDLMNMDLNKINEEFIQNYLNQNAKDQTKKQDAQVSTQPQPQPQIQQRGPPPARRVGPPPPINKPIEKQIVLQQAEEQNTQENNIQLNQIDENIPTQQEQIKTEQQQQNQQPKIEIINNDPEPKQIIEQNIQPPKKANIPIINAPPRPGSRVPPRQNQNIPNQNDNIKQGLFQQQNQEPIKEIPKPIEQVIQPNQQLQVNTQTPSQQILSVKQNVAPPQFNNDHEKQPNVAQFGYQQEEDIGNLNKLRQNNEAIKNLVQQWESESESEVAQQKELSFQADLDQEIAYQDQEQSLGQQNYDDQQQQIKFDFEPSEITNIQQQELQASYEQQQQDIEFDQENDQQQYNDQEPQQNQQNQYCQEVNEIDKEEILHQNQEPLQSFKFQPEQQQREATGHFSNEQLELKNDNQYEQEFTDKQQQEFQQKIEKQYDISQTTQTLIDQLNQQNHQLNQQLQKLIHKLHQVENEKSFIHQENHYLKGELEIQKQYMRNLEEQLKDAQKLSNLRRKEVLQYQDPINLDNQIQAFQSILSKINPPQRANIQAPLIEQHYIEEIQPMSVVNADSGSTQIKKGLEDHQNGDSQEEQPQPQRQPKQSERRQEREIKGKKVEKIERSDIEPQQKLDKQPKQERQEQLEQRQEIQTLSNQPSQASLTSQSKRRVQVPGTLFD